MRQRRLRDARAVLEICARDVCPRAARTDCQEWLTEVVDAQPSILIAAHEVRGEGSARDVHGIRAIIDGSLMVERADESPVLLDPGRHQLRLERTGARPVDQEVDVREGEKARVIDVYWRTPVVATRSRPVPASVYATGAIGLVALGVGGYFEAEGLSQRSQLDSCKARKEGCTQSQIDSARNLTRAGDVTIGGGLFFLLGATILYFTRPWGETTPPQAPDKHDRQDGQLGWMVEPAPGGFFALLRGSL